MSGFARIIGASFLGLIAAALFVAGWPPALDAYRAERAVSNGCADDLATVPVGTWVSLEDCAVDKFHSSAFRDDSSGATFVLAPLRGQAYDLEAPAGLALAYAGDGPVRFAPHADVELYTLRDLTAVVIGPLAGLRGAHLESPEVDSGLDPGAVVLEARAPPSTQLPLTLLAGGGVFLALAAWVAMRGRQQESAPTGVRWGLVAVLLIVSLAASFRALQWYLDPMRQTDEYAARNARRPPAARPRPAPTAAAVLPDPSPDEISALGSADGLERLRAADLLMTRAVTPDVISLVERTLETEPEGALRQKLVCLKARFPGPETLDYLIGRFPTNRDAIPWTPPPDIKCTLDALVARIEEDPLRVRDALVPAALADSGFVRAPVLAAFRRVDIAVPPLEVLKALNSDRTDLYRYGIEAALALGAIRYNRSTVERAAVHHDPSVRAAVRFALVRDPRANAARIVAALWLDGPLTSGPELQMARERERAQHDVSAALVEVLNDEQASEARRQRAVEAMVELDEVGVVPELEAIQPTLEATPLRAAVEAAIVHFDPKRHRPHRMRALTP